MARLFSSSQQILHIIKPVTELIIYFVEGPLHPFLRSHLPFVGAPFTINVWGSGCQIDVHMFELSFFHFPSSRMNFRFRFPHSSPLF